MSFVHLHLHTEYSLIDGLIRIERLAEKAVELNMPAMAVTEYGNTFSAVKFYRAMLSAGVKPVIGAELSVLDESGAEAASLVLLCQHIEGFRNLARLLSRGYREGQRRGLPLVREAWLADHSEGLIALSGAEQGDFGRALLSRAAGRAEAVLEKWRAWFPDRFYIELQRTGRPRQDRYINEAVYLAGRFEVPVVATNHACFMEEADFEAHEARVSIHQGYTLKDSRRPQNHTRQQYIRSAAEMGALFADLPEALENSLHIAARCNIEFQLDRHFLPRFAVNEGETQDQRLIQDAEAGLKTILAGQSAPGQVQPADYLARLKTEIEVITRMGYAGYFLIVADFIRWAKQNGIPVGPGRGSGAGSLVAYALDMTELDPIKYELLFERFLNPERVSLPDFDIDFCMERRDEVIEYVAAKYGREHVSQIITFGRMAAKAVVRDVGRALGFPYGFVDQIAKLIPFDLSMTLARALAEEEALQERYEKEDDVRLLIDLARKLEGIARNAGRHAGGVVIAPSPLHEYMPLYCEQGSESPVTQFDMGDVEAIGLVKFDFLGLRTLTIIDWALRDINRLRQGQGQPEIDIRQLPLNDAKTYQLIRRMDTTAVFQLESDGIRKLIKRLRPDTFDDLVALVALYRPGPLQSGMVDDFVDRKHGRAPIQYMHDRLESVLQPTYGVILYQEQVMQIARTLAGYSLSGADLLRRAMGKKKPEEMARQREIFMAGARETGVAERQAALIFGLMEKFAGYGFNKSHSVAYALVAYQTAWLKAHYPAAFMAAVLSADMDNTDKIVLLLEEVRRMRIRLLPPSVNQGRHNFTVTDEQTICYGLAAIKGVGTSAIEAIMQEREANGPYQDLFDLCRRLDLRRVNRRVLDALIRAGAMDELGPGRGALAHNLAAAVLLAEQHGQNSASGQNDMFGLDQATGDGPADPPGRYRPAPEWSEAERLAGEKETLGFYLKGHPINRYEDELREIVSVRLGRLRPGRDKLTVAGYIMNIRTRKGRQGRMAELRLDDRTARALVNVYAREYQKYRKLLQRDQLVVIKGRAVEADYAESGVSIRASEIFRLDEIRGQRASLILTMRAAQLQNGGIDRLKQALIPFKNGASAVQIHYHNGRAAARLNLGPAWCLTINDELLDRLSESIGKDNVKIDYNIRRV